jgi:hypothetical protein
MLLHGGLAWDGARETVPVQSNPAPVRAAAQPGREIAAALIVLIGGVAALLVWGVIFRVRIIGGDLSERREVAWLHNAVLSFCTDERLGRVGYLPSRIDPSGNDVISMWYMKKIFPYTQGGLVVPSEALEGDQALVFFLGGPGARPGAPSLGWSPDPVDPTATYGEHFKFIEFDPSRLVIPPGRNTVYPSYVDRFGTPYAYFCPFRDQVNPTTSRAVWGPPMYTPDCEFLRVQPYAGQNPTSFQIIAAGANGKFGLLGAQWTPENAATVYPPGSEGYDDIANFLETPLGGRRLK